MNITADRLRRALPAGHPGHRRLGRLAHQEHRRLRRRGRSLPLVMVITTTFATWFGAETVMGIPAKFVQGRLGPIVEGPVRCRHVPGAGGPVLRRRLYRMNLLTIGDFYRQRFGGRRGLLLGWPSSSATWAGWRRRSRPWVWCSPVLTNGAMSRRMGMIVGTAGGAGLCRDRRDSWRWPGPTSSDDRAGGRPVHHRRVRR